MSLRFCVASRTIPFIRRSVFNQSRSRSRKTSLPEVCPGFVERHQGRRAVQSLLNPAEQVQQDRDDGLVVELEEILGLERQEAAGTEHVFIGIEQLAERPRQRVELECFADFQILHVRAELRQRP